LRLLRRGQRSSPNGRAIHPEGNSSPFALAVRRDDAALAVSPRCAPSFTEEYLRLLGGPNAE